MGCEVIGWVRCKWGTISNFVLWLLEGDFLMVLWMLSLDWGFFFVFDFYFVRGWCISFKKTFGRVLVELYFC